MNNSNKEQKGDKMETTTLKVKCAGCSNDFLVDKKYEEYYRNNPVAAVCKTCNDELEYIQSEADMDADY